VSKRRTLVEQLAPPAPPCFGSRLQWLEFLISAAEEHRPDHGHGPLVFEAGQPVRFNQRFDFCADCPSDYRRAQQTAKRCFPDWLTRSIPTLTDVVEPESKETTLNDSTTERAA